MGLSHIKTKRASVHDAVISKTKLEMLSVSSGRLGVLDLAVTDQVTGMLS